MKLVKRVIKWKVYLFMFMLGFTIQLDHRDKAAEGV